jgi:hypothetical protein
MTFSKLLFRFSIVYLRPKFSTLKIKTHLITILKYNKFHVMKKSAEGEYIAPEIDVIVIKAEQGFATSGDTESWDKEGDQSWS